jgi:peptidyl-tRNA hydrolase, PTH1 family
LACPEDARIRRIRRIEGPVKIVVGLGNPGKQYGETRHNVGWMVLDRLADRGGRAGRGRERDAAASVRVHVEGLDLLLVKPTTYMNLSGLAVRKVLARERVKLEDVLVVVDDFALPLGKLRLRERGSAGGHNGLRSIIAEMGTQEFARLRVGIGEPSRDATDHVLSRFDAAERALLAEVIDAAADAVEEWARDGVARASNRWNAWTPAATTATPDAATTTRAASGTPGAPTGGPDGRGPDDSRRPRGGATDAREADGVVRTRTGWRKLLPRREPEARP